MAILVDEKTKTVSFSGEDIKGLVDVCEFARRYSQTYDAVRIYGDAHVSDVCAVIGNTFAQCKE